MASERIIAVGLLTQQDVEMLGQSFDRLWPVDETPCFGGLLHAIDVADRDIRRARDTQPAPEAPEILVSALPPLRTR